LPKPVPPFVPLFSNPHWQTIAGHFWPRSTAGPRPPVERSVFPIQPDAAVLVESERPAGNAAGEIVLLHGLEGSADSGYMRGLAGAALHAGFAAHRFNMRTCGGTARLSKTLYHAGLTTDLLAVVRALRQEGRGPVFLVGFSLGGNVALKLAGELGSSPQAEQLVRAVCAVSTPLDLAACVCRLARPSNRLYELRFVRRMRARLCATGRYRPHELAGLRSVQAIDDRITAPAFGFAGAAGYYRTQSALPYLGAIRVPTLLIQAQDDLFVPFETFAGVCSNPAIELLAPPHGGHMGFIGRRPYRFWLDHAIMEWIGTQAKGI
jgi:uncharacterized protein